MCREEVDITKLTVLKKKIGIEIEIEDDDIVDEDTGEVEIDEKYNDDEKEVLDTKVREVKVRSEKTKPETIADIIYNKPEGKFLVFSSYEQSFSLIKSIFNEKEIDYMEIKGSKTSRENRLAEYQYGDRNVIFLNSKFNGAGINLQITTDIILYHKMPVHIEKQVIGRANRIGRVGTLTIHYLEGDE